MLDARSLGEADILAIAREVGYSETAFVLPTPEPATFRVRYFSPKSEVAFCGLATVAAAAAAVAAVALAERDGPGEFAFTTPGGTCHGRPGCHRARCLECCCRPAQRN